MSTSLKTKQNQLHILNSFLEYLIREVINMFLNYLVKPMLNYSEHYWRIRQRVKQKASKNYENDKWKIETKE